MAVKRMAGLNSFERRQQLVETLRQQPGLRIHELAKLLAVSPGTVRNDLIALEHEGRLIRVHGGAAIIDNGLAIGPSFAARSRTNDQAKRIIAAHAAELVEDGDAIILDASTTVLSFTHNLHRRHNLRVFTNGIEAARSMAKDPTNNVTLLGGVLNSDGESISGLVSEQFLRGLHIKTAIVSCSGFSREAGLTEVDINQAQLKNKMIGAASRVIALVDSSKFGKMDLTSFATFEQVDFLYTDQALSDEWIARLKQSGLAFSVCSENHAETFTPVNQTNCRYRIGFANQSEQLPFAWEVRKGIERAARQAGNIDLVLADNQLSADTALKVAENFLSQALDLVIEYQIDEQMGNRIMSLYQDARIPAVSVDIAMIGATYFGVDNFRAGQVAGAALGEWVRDHWSGEFDRLVILEEPSAGAIPAARMHSQVEGFRSILGPVVPEKCLFLNSENTCDMSEKAMLNVLHQHTNLHRWAVIGFNDGAVLGALEAARKLGREQDVVIVGQGADQRVLDELAHPGSCLSGSTTFYPEKYGEKLVPLALQILRGEPVPPAVYIEQTFLLRRKPTDEQPG